jgi:hypothetical protein
MLSRFPHNLISRLLSQAFLVPARARPTGLRIRLFDLVFTVLAFFIPVVHVYAQSTASIEGQVVDPDGAVVEKAEILAASEAIGVYRKTRTDAAGRYQFAALPVADYRLQVRATGFKEQILERIQVEVGRRLIQDFRLQPGDLSVQVFVTSTNTLVEQTTVSVGHLIDRRMVQEVPLNGRYFLDLGLLVPGSVTPPQGAFSAAPLRGVGSLAINTAGNREETVNYMVNGITLNNLTSSSIGFQPPITTVQEFKIDNSTFSAEYGQSSGADDNIATRSGASEFHGDLY